MLLGTIYLFFLSLKLSQLKTQLRCVSCYHLLKICGVMSRRWWFEVIQTTPEESSPHWGEVFLWVVWPLILILYHSKQGATQEKEENDADLTATQSPGVQEWLAQARTTRTHRRQSSLQQQKVKHLLPSSRGQLCRGKNLSGLFLQSRFCGCSLVLFSVLGVETRPGLGWHPQYHHSFSLIDFTLFPMKPGIISLFGVLLQSWWLVIGKP